MTPEFDPAEPPLIDEDRHPVFDSWESVENIESLDCSQNKDDEPQHPIRGTSLPVRHSLTTPCSGASTRMTLRR